MATVRLTAAQERKVRKAAVIVLGKRAKAVTVVQAIVALAENTIRPRRLFWNKPTGPVCPLREDPMFDHRIVFSSGKKDDRSLDEILYGHE